MKLFIKLRNKYFTAVASFILLIMASVGLFNLCASPSNVDASMVKFDNEKSITITNGSFTNFSTSSSYPYTISGYNTSGNSTPSMKAGAINISEKEYAKNYDKYGLTEYGNPKGTGSDNYVLMINTEQDSDYTYTSSEFTLPANGHYYVTVSAKTIGDNSIASVFLMQNNVIFENCLIENITSSTWSNYTFFITTNSYEEVTLKFGMQIGSRTSRASGCVLFDELHAGQISSETLQNCLNNFTPGTYQYREFRSQNAYKAYNFDNKILQLNTSNIGQNYDIIDRNYFATSSSGGGQKLVDISNNIMNISATDTYVIYKGEEERLQPNSTYRFSIYVKASQITSGSAFVKLDEILDEEDEEYNDFMESTKDEITAKSSNLTISSVTSNTVTDGYEEYVIYVKTGALKSSKVQFSFGVGSETSNATANVSFKNYLIERVPYNAYSSASAGTKIGKVDISERISLNSSEYSNYTFDKMQSESFDGVPYPATPTDWTKSSDNKGYQLSGVVNLSSFNNVMDKYSNKINTIATPSTLTASLNNNVLMIYNGTNGYQGYSSTSKSLTANTKYKITVFVNTHMWDSTSNGVFVVAKTGSTVLAQASNIKTSGAWQRVVLYVNTPPNSVDLTVELALGYGNKLSSGYAFFDNILIETADENNEFSNRFSEFTVANNGEIELDLTNPMLSSTTARDYNIPVLYTGNNVNGTTVNAGIVDLSQQNLNAIIASGKADALRSLSGDNKNVLAISTALNQDSYYQYTSVLNYKFESDKYYKLSFDLFTDGISQEEKKEKYENGKLAQGANVELTNLGEAKFYYINSNGKWTTYEIYIGVDSTVSSQLIFGLGSPFTGCYGKAFLGNINLVELEEADFTASTASETVLKVNTIATEDEEDNTDDKKSDGNNFSWVYIPTIATFLAIVVAVVGVFVRRNIKFKKHVGNKKAVYDRDITVMQSKYRRLASDARDKEVRELTKECNELIDLRNEHEDKYKEALSRLRSVRLSNRDGSKRNEIAAIEREVKHISKEVARYGVQINNYENEIEFMQTEAYLIDLEKRMMREDASARSQIRKEAEMPEEKRLQAIAKRESKQAKAAQKAELKAERLAKKQEQLQKEREAIQTQLAQAKELDKKYVKEQELLKIRVEEAKLAKERAKAEKELKKLEKEKAEQELEKSQIEQELSKVKQEEIEQLDEEANSQQEIKETIDENLNDNLELAQEEEKVVEVTSQEMVEGDKLNQESESEDKNN